MPDTPTPLVRHGLRVLNQEKFATHPRRTSGHSQLHQFHLRRISALEEEVERLRNELAARSRSVGESPHPSKEAAANQRIRADGPVSERWLFSRKFRKLSNQKQQDLIRAIQTAPIGRVADGKDFTVVLEDGRYGNAYVGGGKTWWVFRLAWCAGERDDTAVRRLVVLSDIEDQNWKRCPSEACSHGETP